MGFLATVVEFLRSTVEGVPTPEAKVDRGGNDTVTGYQFGPPGIDAHPLPGDVAYLGDDLGKGSAQILGYQDPKNAGTAGAGEHRLYSRSSDGLIVAEIWLKADGSILISNAVGASTVELAADGAIALSNATGGIAVDAAGNVTATTPLGQFGSGTHTHTTPFGPSGPPIPGT